MRNEVCLSDWQLLTDQVDCDKHAYHCRQTGYFGASPSQYHAVLNVQYIQLQHDVT